MSRIGLWLRWSLRDLRNRWALVIAISLVIAIGTGIYSGLGSMENWRVASNDASFELLHAHDLEVSLSEGATVPAGQLERLARSIPAAGETAALEERLVLPTQVAIDRAGRPPLLTPGELVGAGPRGPGVDGVAVDAGRGLGPGDAGEPVAVLEASFGEYHGLPASGSLRIAGGRELRYVGQGRSPEYFLVTRPGGGDFGGAEASFAVLFAPLATVQKAAGDAAVNDLVVRLRDGARIDAVRGQLAAALRERGIAGEVTAQADEIAHRVLYQDAEGDQRLFNVFAILILAGAALATYNLSSRIVEAQRREIGIGMALGVRPAELAIRPLLLGLQIAAAGTVFGIVLGVLAGDIFRGVLEDLLPLPATETPFELAVFARGAVLGLVLPLVATAIPVWRGLRLTPVEAIRVGFRSARSSGLARLGARLRLPGSSIVQLPLRNVLRAPRRTIATVLGIGAVVTVVVAFLGFVDSFLATVDRSEAEIAGDTPDRISVQLEGYEPESAPIVRRIERVPGVAAAEPRLVLPARLDAGEDGFDASVTLLDLDASRWAPTLVEGELPRPGEPEIVIAEEAAEDLGVGVGDVVDLDHPAPGAGGELRQERTATRVAGLHPNPFRTFAYMDRDAAVALGVPGIVNSLDVYPEPGASKTEIARALFDEPAVASVEKVTATTTFVRERLDDFIGVLRLTIGFALALALLIAFNSTRISADERARENATMIAFGIPAREAIGVTVAESMITGILGTLAGLAGGAAVIGWVVSTTLPQTLPDVGLVVSLSAGSMLAAGLVGVVAVTLAPLAGARRIAHMDVPSTLRVVE